MKTSAVLAAILIAAGVLIFAGAFFAAGFDFSVLDTATYETKTYSVGESFDRIKIQSAETDVVFKPSEDGAASVVWQEKNGVRQEVFVENGTLHIVAAETQAWYERPLFSFRSPSMTVYLPQSEYAALTVDCRTGDLSLPAAFNFGDIDVSVSTGDVNCASSAAGSVRIASHTGDITLNGVRAGKIELSVATGDIKLKNTSCDEDLLTDFGTGTAGLTEVTCKNLYAKGSTGDIRLTDTVAAARLQIECGTGDVRFDNCDAGQIFVKTSTGDVVGTLRTEKVFAAKTSTGSVSVPDTAAGGKCEITASTGDIRIGIANRK